MFGAAAPYLMAVSAMFIAGLSALTLIRTVKHFDPPEPAPTEKSKGSVTGTRARASAHL